VPLFEKLLAIGIGFAGTTQIDSAGFPSSLKIEKPKVKKILLWGHISREVVDNICCLIWKDNSLVLFITSYHDITKKVERLHRLPKVTSTNASTVWSIFKDVSLKVQPIP